MDSLSVTDTSLQQLYQQKILTPTGIYYSPQEVEEDIQAGKQVNQDQMTVLNNYWQAAGSQKIQQQPAQQAVESSALQTQENVGFFTKLKNNFFGLLGKKSAQGNAVQEQTPQKFTVKQTEADQIRDRIAGRHNPRADHVSYEMIRQMNVKNQEAQNTRNAAREAGMNVPAEGVRNSTFLNFVHGFRADKNGNPLTEQDKRFKEEDLDWVRRYVSTDKAEHFSALNQTVDELLNFNFTPAMLKDTYIDKHFEELNSFRRRLGDLQNLEKQEGDYFFQAVEPKKLELLHARHNQLNDLIDSTLTYYGMRKGVDIDKCAYFNSSKEEMERAIADKAAKLLNPEESFKQLAKKEKMVAEFEKRLGKNVEKQKTKINKQREEQGKETRGNKSDDRYRGLRFGKSIAALDAEIDKARNLTDEARLQADACSELQKEIADQKKAREKAIEKARDKAYRKDVRKNPALKETKIAYLKEQTITPEEEIGNLARQQELYWQIYRGKQASQNLDICHNVRDFFFDGNSFGEKLKIGDDELKLITRLNLNAECRDAARFFLKGDNLGDDALKLIRRLGLNDDLTDKNEELNSAGTGEGAGA